MNLIEEARMMKIGYTFGNLAVNSDCSGKDFLRIAPVLASPSIVSPDISGTAQGSGIGCPGVETTRSGQIVRFVEINQQHFTGRRAR